MVKTTEEIRDISAELQRYWSAERITVALTKDEVEAAIVAINAGESVEIPQQLKDDINEALQPPLPEVVVLPPNWLLFNQGMLMNLTYNRLIGSGNQLMVSRLEAMSISGNENWGMLKFFWDHIVAGQTATTEEIKKLNEIASAAHMQFQFESDLSMTVTES